MAQPLTNDRVIRRRTDFENGLGSQQAAIPFNNARPGFILSPFPGDVVEPGSDTLGTNAANGGAVGAGSRAAKSAVAGFGGFDLFGNPAFVLGLGFLGFVLWRKFKK